MSHKVKGSPTASFTFNPAPQKKRKKGDLTASAEALCHEGLGFYRNGELEPARKLFKKALKLRREAFGEEHVKVAATLHAIGMCSFYKNAFYAAEPKFRKALEIAQPLLGEKDKFTVELFFKLGLTLVRIREDEGVELLKRGVEGLKELCGDRFKRLGEICQGLGEINEQEEMYEEALIFYDMAEKNIRKNYPKTSSQVKEISKRIASCVNKIFECLSPEL